MIDENIDNELPATGGAERSTVSIVNGINKKILIAGALAVLLSAFIVLLAIEKNKNVALSPSEGSQNSDTLGNPEKQSFGEALPVGFPGELVLGDNTPIIEGYDLVYPGVVQHSVEYAIGGAPAEAFSLYTDLLRKKGWVIMNSHESEMVSALYAMRKNDELNIAIQNEENSEKQSSRISVSLISK